MMIAIENEAFFVSHPKEIARILVIKERTYEIKPTQK